MTVCHLGDLGYDSDMSVLKVQSITMSDYVLNLPKEAKERYRSKLIVIQCAVDLYIDMFDYTSVHLCLTLTSTIFWLTTQVFCQINSRMSLGALVDIRWVALKVG